MHPEDYTALKKALGHNKQIGIHHQDGYQNLKAFLPPKERRGLVLIDPPYENPEELLSLPATLAQALQRWETGVYALWYPIKTRQQINHFYRALKAKIQKSLLIVELSIHAEDIPTQLNGSGMVIVNPPWQLDQTLKDALPWLWHALSPDRHGSIKIRLEDSR